MHITRLYTLVLAGVAIAYRLNQLSIVSGTIAAYLWCIGAHENELILAAENELISVKSYIC